MKVYQEVFQYNYEASNCIGRKRKCDMNEQKNTSNQTFDNFIVSRSNEKAYAACLDLVENPEGKFVVLYGANSHGKTHLLRAVESAFKEKNPSSKISTVNYEDLISLYITAIHKEEADRFIDNLIETDLLLMDNMQFVAGKSATQDEISNWIKKMLSAGKTVVIAFDRPIRYYTNLINEIKKSDTEKCTVVEVKRPDYQLRKQYLKHLLKKYPVTLPFSIKGYIPISHRLSFSAISGFIHKCSLLENQKGARLNILDIKKCLSSYITVKTSEKYER